MTTNKISKTTLDNVSSWTKLKLQIGSMVMGAIAMLMPKYYIDPIISTAKEIAVPALPYIVSLFWWGGLFILLTNAVLASLTSKIPALIFCISAIFLSVIGYHQIALVALVMAFISGMIYQASRRYMAMEI